MGTSGKQIVGKEHLGKIVELLSAAFCDEWLSHYQYWIGAKVVKGPMKDAAAAEFLQHAADEMRHADMVADRLLQLGAFPELEPKNWVGTSNCDYDPPMDHYVQKVLEQNLKGERCAIQAYSEIAKFTREIDPVTYNLAVQILQDEVAHEEDLQNLDEDLDLLMQRSRKG
jgi:bacterioferritin